MNDLLQLAFNFDTLVGGNQTKSTVTANLGEKKSSKVVVVDFTAARTMRTEMAEKILYRKIIESIQHIA